MDKNMYDDQVVAWSKPPIGGENVDSQSILSWSEQMVRDWVRMAYVKQYTQPSNWNGLYRSALKLDQTIGRWVLDYGSGFGFDALTYARMGNQVALADINPTNLRVATRILNCHGYSPYATYHIPAELSLDDMVKSINSFDVFHCSGVFHHLPPQDQQSLLGILKVMDSPTRPIELRLMVYTHVLWLQGAQALYPTDHDVRKAHATVFQRFVRYCDAVGNWADYFTPEKMAAIGDQYGWVLRDWTWLRPDAGYAVAILSQ